jgi:glyoxylase-like metal-dependent hydrolase (beta-lactamase superfamily II)
MKEIVKGVFTWAWTHPERKVEFNGWYIDSAKDPIVIDPPSCGDDVLEAIEERGAPCAILLTNKDHVRDAERFAARFRAPVLIHPADAPLVSIRIGGLYRPGEELPAGLEAIRVSDAKSPGECALLLRRSNALILGDALIGVPAGQLNMLPDAKFADPAKAREGIRALMAYAFDAVLVGDGASFARGGRKAMEEWAERTS